MEAFAQFASDLDASTQKLLARGARLTQLLKQPQYTPFPIEEQVLSIYAGTNGYLDDLPVDQVNEYEAQMLNDARANATDILETIREQKKLDDDLKASMDKYLEKFTAQFAKTLDQAA